MTRWVSGLEQQLLEIRGNCSGRGNIWQGLKTTGYCKRVTMRKGSCYYVHVIYIWNCSAELKLYNKDFTGHVCENQIETSVYPRSAQMWFSMDVAYTTSMVQ